MTELRQAVASGFYFSVNHKMVESEKGRLIVANIPMYWILTETDAPFTFSAQIQSRTASLEAAVGGIAQIKKQTIWETKALIFENFKLLIS